MTSLAEFVQELIEDILISFIIIVIDEFIEVLQSLVPGSPNTIWSTEMYPTLILLVILFSIYIVVRRKR